MSVPAPTHLSELCDEVSLDRKTVVRCARLRSHSSFSFSSLRLQIPDEIFRRLLESSGCNIQSDPKLVRVLNFVTQKFIAQIAYDVQQDVLLRNNEASRNDKACCGNCVALIK
jgi:hypothetical protein